MKKSFLISILLLVAISLNVYGEPMEPINTSMERATVLEVEDEEKTEDNISQTQYVKLKVTSGKYKGEIFETENNLSDNFAYDIVVKKGDKVVVAIDEYENGLTDVYISDYARQSQIFYLLIIFILLIIMIGKGKGLKSIITLTITIFMVLKVLLPLMLKGINPIPISVLVSIAITIITIFIVSGINNKSIAAIIGTSSGVIIAGLIAYLVGSQVRLTGLSGEEAIALMYIPQGIDFDFKSLLFSGIILGALGAIMDVGMSIASSIEEIHNANKDLTKKELFNSGMNVGKDIMGTMTNTLILAYTGSSIPLLLLFMAYETSMIKIINLDIIATEIVRSLAGSIGLVLTIPLTALISTFLIKRENKSKIKE
ncbi:TPA: YibE/F family protein [Clostridioides difficile]|jgi:uncharacterized membrane protein